MSKVCGHSNGGADSSIRENQSSPAGHPAGFMSDAAESEKLERLPESKNGPFQGPSEAHVRALVSLQRDRAIHGHFHAERLPDHVSAHRV